MDARIIIVVVTMVCNNNTLIISDSITVVTIGTTPTLVIDIPEGTYGNKCCYRLLLAQEIPDTATINMPVAISISGVTTTVYPLTKCNCTQLTPCALRYRQVLSVLVLTTPTAGTFKVLNKLPCCPTNNLISLPVTPAGGA